MSKTNKSSKSAKNNNLKRVEGAFSFQTAKCKAGTLRFQASVSCTIEGKHVIASYWSDWTKKMPPSIVLAKNYIVRRDDGTVHTQRGALRATIENLDMSNPRIVTLPDGHEIYNYDVADINDFHVVDPLADAVECDF
jgi:hypothetical protein